ncbi:MAG: response regulator transcription factor [Acidobacteriota bacterium]|nr:response regulator transcription factor [Acidobacteriota bacterium]MDQ7087732.1 response regulator transcription factor [Acidobacteriota bacterium]
MQSEIHDVQNTAPIEPSLRRRVQEGRAPMKIALFHRRHQVPQGLVGLLEGAGFRVDCFQNGEQGLARALVSPPDLVLSAMTLDDMDGLDLCRRLRAEFSTLFLPLVLLGEGNDATNRIVAFELGADDVVDPSCSTREIVLRVRGILRRRATAQAQLDEGTALRCAELALFPAENRLLVGREETILTPTECRLLTLFLQRAGRTQKRESLAREVWEEESDNRLRTLDVYIHRLRRKLGREARRLETVVGVGYRLRA